MTLVHNISVLEESHTSITRGFLFSDTNN